MGTTEVVYVRQAGEVVCGFAQGIDIMIVYDVALVVTMLFVPFPQLISYTSASRSIERF